MSIHESIAAIDEYFQSANAIPVTVARIHADSWAAVKQDVSNLLHDHRIEVEELRKDYERRLSDMLARALTAEEALKEKESTGAMEHLLLNHYMRRSGQHAHMTLANWFCAATGFRDSVLQNMVSWKEAAVRIAYLTRSGLQFTVEQLENYNVEQSRNPNFSRS